MADESGRNFRETLTATSNEILLAPGMLALGGICLVRGVEAVSTGEIALGTLMTLGSAAVGVAGFLRRKNN